MRLMSDWLFIRLVLTAALLLWEYAAATANGMKSPRIFLEFLSPLPFFCVVLVINDPRTVIDRLRLGLFFCLLSPSCIRFVTYIGAGLNSLRSRSIFRTDCRVLAQDVFFSLSLSLSLCRRDKWETIRETH